jgi:hypothetical protein
MPAAVLVACSGHTARLIAAEFVVPFRKGGKNDTADAETIAIAALLSGLLETTSWNKRSRDDANYVGPYAGRGVPGTTDSLNSVRRR